MQQVRRRTGDGVQTLVGGIEVGHGRQQTPGVGVARVVEDLVDGAGLHDLARVHDIDIVRHLCHDAEVMGDVDDRNAALLLYAADELEDLCLNGHIQCGGGLIADEQVRVAGQRDGDDHALTHTAGQLVRVALHPLFGVRDTDFFQQLEGLLICLSLGHLEVPEHPFHDLLADGHGGVKAGHGVLEHHGDALAVDVAADPLFIFLQQIDGFRAAVGVMVAELDASAVHLGVLGQNTHGCLHGDGLAGTRLTHQRHRLALVQVDVHAADGVDGAGRRLKGNIKVSHRQDLFSFRIRHVVRLLTYSSSWGQVPRAGRRPAG